MKSFKSIDVNELQTKILALNTQLANKDTEWQGKLGELEFSDLLKDTVKGAGARNGKVVIALLDIANLKNSRNRQADTTTTLEAVKKDNAYLFQDSKTSYVISKTEGSNQNTVDQRGQANAAFRLLFGKE